MDGLHLKRFICSYVKEWDSVGGVNFNNLTNGVFNDGNAFLITKAKHLQRWLKE